MSISIDTINSHIDLEMVYFEPISDSDSEVYSHK